MSTFRNCILWELDLSGGFKRERLKSCSSTTKNVTYPLPQCPWPLNVALSPIKSHDPLIMWSWEITWQTEHFYQSSYGHQTLQSGDLPWETLTHKVIQLFGHVVTWPTKIIIFHCQSACICTTTIPFATNPGRIVTYLERLPVKKILDPLVTCNCKITWQAKANISPLTQCLWRDLPRGAPTNIVTWPFNHVVLRDHMTY